MAGNLIKTMKKFIQALNYTYDYKFVLSIKQFMGREGKTVNVYCLEEATWDEGVKKFYHHEVYSSPSAIRVVLYLRDLWYIENGWELPEDNEKWNVVRKEILEEGKLRGKHGTRVVSDEQDG